VSYERLIERPTDGNGVALGEGDWRLVVEMLLPEAGSSQWGTATWNDGSTGDGVWSSPTWTDVTHAVQGMVWDRGADQFGGRPRTGVLTLTLRVDDADFSPFGASNSAAYFAPGTLVRVACIETGGDWVPQFAGIVESWPQEFNEVAANSHVTVTAVETTAFLARINNNAVTSQGSEDFVFQRFTRLTSEAMWPFGLSQEFGTNPPFGLQATDMADNRLAEIHLTADSTDLFFCSHRSGVGLTRCADARRRPVGDLAGGAEYNERDVEVRYPERLEFNAGTTPAAAPWADLDTNEYLEIPDAANLDFTADIGVAVWLDATWPSNGGVKPLVSKWGATAADQSWRFGINNTGNNPFFEIITSGGASQQYTFTGFEFPTSVLPVWVGVTFDASVSTVRFWYRYTHDNFWNQWGPNVTGSAATVRTTSTAVRVGDPVSGTGIAARYRSVWIWDEITATGGMPSEATLPVVKITPDDIAVADSTASTFTCTTGQTVTISGSGVLSSQTPVVVAATDPIVVANDTEAILNDIRLSRAGGTEQTAIDTYSIGRWKQRVTYSRNDLLLDSDADVLTIAERILARRSRVTLRPTALTVHARRGHTVSNMPEMFSADVGDMVTVRMPGSTRRVAASIASVHHEVALGLWWKATFTFDVFSEAT
jgi:hypothetical protein